jgi:hypothetical protein
LSTHTSKELKTGKAATALPINVDDVVVSHQLYSVTVRPSKQFLLDLSQGVDERSMAET